MTAPLTSWSYSRYAVHELCPLKFKLQFLDKISKPQTPAMARGDKIHKDIASYLLKGTAPPEVKFHGDLIQEIAQFSDKVVEQQWGFNRNWERTGWFGNDTWYRQICDVAICYEDMVVENVDWKTGKRYESNDDQMELSALGIMRHFKPAVHVTTRLVYLDTGEQEFAEYPRADMEKLLAKWERKVQPMFEDTTYLPRPNDKCRFCDYGRDKGGQCRYG